MSQKKETNKEIAIARLHGRIEHEIEVYSANVPNCSSQELIYRIGHLLAGSEPKINVEKVKLHQQVREMDVSNTQAPKKPTVRSAGSYWAKLTPQERSKEMKRRRKKWPQDSLDRWHHKKVPVSVLGSKVKQPEATQQTQ
jgi:hypothetical protein